MKKFSIFMFVLFGIIFCSSFGYAALSTNQLVYYKIDETSGSTVFDSMGLFNGIASSGAIITPYGKIGYARNFSVGQIDIGNIGSMNDFTINAWIYPHNTTSPQRIIASRKSDGSAEWQVEINPGFSNKLYFGIQTSATSYTGGPCSINITPNVWTMITLTRTGATLDCFVNGVDGSISQSTSGSPTGTITTATTTHIGHNPTGLANYFGGRIDEVGIWTRVLSADEVMQLYNSGIGLQYPYSVSPSNSVVFVSPPTPANNTIQFVLNSSITIRSNATVTNYTNSTIRFFYENGTLRNSMFGTSNITELNISGIAPGIYFYNVSAEQSNGSIYYSETRKFTVYNLTAGNIIVPVSNQNVTEFLNITWLNSSTTNNSVAISNYTVNLLNLDGSLNRTLNVTSGNYFFWNTYPFNLSVGMYQIQISTADVNNNQVNTSVLFNLTGNAKLNITVYDDRTNMSISNFSIILNDTSRLYVKNYSTTLGYIEVDIVRGDFYSIFFDAVGYAYATANYSANQSSLQKLNQSLTKTNSISMFLYDEVSGGLLTGVNVSITLTATSINFTQTNYTTIGQFFISGLNEALYSIEFSAINYSSRTFFVTMTNRTTQSLVVYLLPEAVIIGAYVKDPGDQPIGDALFTVQRLINNSWITVAQGTTDGVGYIQFELQNGGSYTGILTAAGYQPRSFPFVPYYVNQPYTFKLQEDNTKIFIPFNSFVGYSYTPKNTQLNQTNTTFSFTTVQLNSSYGSNSVLWTAINCSGSWFNMSGSPSGATVSQTMDLSGYSGVIICMFAFQVDNYEPYSFNVNYFISSYSVNTNNSIIKGVEILEENNSAAWNAILGLFIIFILSTVVRWLSGGEPEAVTIGVMAGLLIITFIGLVNFAMGIIICFEIGMIFFNRGGV